MRLWRRVFWGWIWIGSALSACESVDMGGRPSIPGSTEERYRSHYSAYMSAHRSMIMFGYSEPQNFPSAAESANLCIEELQGMRELIMEEAQRAGLQRIIENYRTAVEDFRRRRAPTQNKVDIWERDVRGEFTFVKVSLKPNPPGIAAAPPPVEDDGSPGWISFTAWEKLHAELAACWNEGKDCSPAYQKLVQVLRDYHAKLTGERQAKLQTYLDAYSAAQTETSGFTAVPEGSSREAVAADLRILEKAIRANCAPR